MTDNISRSTLLSAIILGSLLSAFLSSSLVLAGLRAGITPGVSPLIVLLGWVIIAPFVRGSKSPFLIILQTTGSAGAAVTAGVIFTAPVIQIASADGVAPGVQAYPLIFASLAGALLGWGCVGLTTRRMIFDTSLPAPEAVACSELIDVAEQDDSASRPNLFYSLIMPGVITACCSAGLFLGYLRDKLLIVKIYGASLPIPLSPLYFGIGAILSLETASLLALGGLGHAAIRAVSVELNAADDTFRWVGAAAMTVSILYTLLCYLKEQWLGFSGNALILSAKSDPVDENSLNQLEQTPEHYRLFLSFCVLLGSLIAVVPQLGDLSNITPLFVGKILILGGVFVVIAIALSAIGALLSLQVGSSASPVSGTVFVGMLCLAIVFTALFSNPRLESLVYLLVTLCVAICAANDSSQDYRTLVLQKLPISLGYLPQLAGLLAAVVVVPPTLWLAHHAFYLGSETLPAPQASFFSVVLLSLLEQGGKPVNAIFFGAVVGLFAVVLEQWGKHKGRHFSSVSLCVGLYLPPSIGIGILIGACCRHFGAGSRAKLCSTGILAAAAFISIDAAVSLGFGFANIFGLWASGSNVVESSGVLSWIIAIGLLASLTLNFARDRGSSS